MLVREDEKPASCSYCEQPLNDSAKFFDWPDIDEIVAFCGPNCAGLWLWHNFPELPSGGVADENDDVFDLTKDDWETVDREVVCHWCGLTASFNEGGWPFCFGELGCRVFCDENCAECWLKYNVSLEDIAKRGSELVLDDVEDGDNCPDRNDETINSRLFCGGCGIFLKDEEALFRDFDGSYYCSMSCQIRSAGEKK